MEVGMQAAAGSPADAPGLLRRMCGPAVSPRSQGAPARHVRGRTASSASFCLACALAGAAERPPPSHQLTAASSSPRFADGRHRKLHPGPCAEWGSKARLADTTWETPILAQVAGIELDNATIAQVVAVLGSTQRPVAIDRARFERQMRDLALEHAAGGVADTTYLARMGELRTQLSAVDEGSNA